MYSNSNLTFASLTIRVTETAIVGGYRFFVSIFVQRRCTDEWKDVRRSEKLITLIAKFLKTEFLTQAHTYMCSPGW